MSDPIDFAAILTREAEGFTDFVGLAETIAAAQLAAKVPGLCPDCEGVGHLGPATGSHQRDYGRACAHLDAPTIAELLAIGRLVWIQDTTVGHRNAPPEQVESGSTPA